MSLKDLSMVFIAGILAIVFVAVSLLSKLFIEKGGLLVIIAALAVVYLLKFLLGVFL